MATENAEIVEPPDPIEADQAAHDAEITPLVEDAKVPHVISSGARLIRR